MLGTQSDLLSTAEAARLLGVSPDRVRQLATSGKLPPILSPSTGRLFARRMVEGLARERALGRPA
jgi:excisionase family DNA binding protein